MLRARRAAAAAIAVRFDTVGSAPALASPFSRFAAPRAASGECVPGLPMVMLRVENLLPVRGSVPRGL